MRPQCNGDVCEHHCLRHFCSWSVLDHISLKRRLVCSLFGVISTLALNDTYAGTTEQRELQGYMDTRLTELATIAHGATARPMYDMNFVGNVTALPPHRAPLQLVSASCSLHCLAVLSRVETAFTVWVLCDCVRLCGGVLGVMDDDPLQQFIISGTSDVEVRRAIHRSRENNVVLL